MNLYKEKVFDFIRTKVFLSMLIAMFVVYSHTLGNGFVLDDQIQILGNPVLHSFSNFRQFFFGRTFSAGPADLRGNYYRPLMNTTTALFYSIFGPQPWPFHLLAITLHTLNGYLVYRLFKQFFTSKVAFFAGFAYLLHPQNSENVLYIANIQDIYFVLFGLLGLLWFIEKKEHKYRDVVTYLFLFLSLLSKETGVFFFGLVFLWQWFYERKRIVITFFYAIFTVAIFLFMRFGVAQIAFQMDRFAPITRLSFENRLMHIPLLITHYFVTFFFPYKLVIAQNWILNSFEINTFYLPLAFLVLALVGLFVGYFYIARTKHEKWLYLFFTYWLFSGLFIHMQLHPLDATVADRWFYFPMIGMIGLLMIALQKVPLKKFLIVCAVIIIVLYAGRTFVRGFDWRDEETLARADLKLQENNFVLHNIYGLSYFRREDTINAEIHFNRSINIDPGNNLGWHNLGVVYEFRGVKEKNKEHFWKAIEYYQKAIETGHDPTSYINKAQVMIFKVQEDHKKTDEFLTTALERYPRIPQLLAMHALMQYKLGYQAEALSLAEQALRLDPNNGLYRQIFEWVRLKQEINLTE